MPKRNTAGYKPAKNYVPRTSAGKGKPAGASGRPASDGRGPSHRGYRPAEDGATAPKKRWTAEDRAARAARPGAARSGSDRRDAPARGRSFDGERQDRRPSYGRDDRPSFDRDDRRASRDRDDRRPSTGRDDRRPAYGRDERPTRRDDRPAYGRDERPVRRDDRAARRDDRPSYGRDERPARRDERPAYDRDDRRPAYDRDDRRHSSGRDDRPRYEADRDRRPSSDRGDRPFRGDRAERTERFDRPARGDRARDSWGDRPARRDEVRQAPPVVEDVVLERLEAVAIEADSVEGLTFADLGLGTNIVAELAQQGATTPFPIQAATIPAALSGRDVLGRGRTGSGKTIAFGAAVVEKLMENGSGKRRTPGRAPRALILAPTRELALQIDRTVQPLARAVGLFTTQVYGGVPQGRQVGALLRGVDIVIGTPGRIEDLHRQGKLRLDEVAITVVDEADHMCDLGFLEPVQRILRLTAEGGQRMLFSATLDTAVASLVEEFLVDPSVHEVAGEDDTAGDIDHRVLIIDHRQKADVIARLVEPLDRAIVFTRTRAYAEMVTEDLEAVGIPAVALHGDLNQSRRTRNLAQLTNGRARVLVATDVAARGIHVDDIDLVVQADAAEEYKTYLHRAGRTGRAGKSGTVVTLATRGRERRVRELLERAGVTATVEHDA